MWQIFQTRLILLLWFLQKRQTTFEAMPHRKTIKCLVRFCVCYIFDGTLEKVFALWFVGGRVE